MVLVSFPLTADCCVVGKPVITDTIEAGGLKLEDVFGEELAEINDLGIFPAFD